MKLPLTFHKCPACYKKLSSYPAHHRLQDSGFIFLPFDPMETYRCRNWARHSHLKLRFFPLNSSMPDALSESLRLMPTPLFDEGASDESYHIS
jgi:hypothetical protein